ncbi:MAG: amidohydrolase family protein [Candidatus Hodarchaeota archaeon]
MITVLTENQESFFIPLIDFHTHIGRVKIETTKGTAQRVNRPQDIINLYEKLQYEIHKRISQNQSNYYVTLPSAEELAHPLYPMVRKLLESNGSKTRGWIVDHIVCFPFNDLFHKKTTPKFVKSNEYVRQQTQSFDFSFRFLPFCRVDATDEGAPEEVKNSVGLGMRGLKLHPMSQGWVEKIVSTNCKKTLQTAGKLKIPIIFDVPNKGVAVDITTISEEARQEVDFPMNVVLGHSAFDYSSPEVFECLSKDAMFVETSGMRGKDVEIFFSNVMKTGGWEEKILFGTDSNYFGVLQAADFITFLLSHKFKDLIEKNGYDIEPLIAAAKILGGNALRIIPPLWVIKGQVSQKIQKSSKKGFITNLPILKTSLKKFTTNKNNIATIDLAKLQNKNLSVQILTMRQIDHKLSCVLETKDKDQKIILRSISDLERAINLPIKSLNPVEVVSKSRVRKTRLKEHTFLEMFNG